MYSNPNTLRLILSLTDYDINLKVNEFTMIFFLRSLNTVSEDFESVVGPGTEIKEIQIAPVQEGNQISFFV